jgi:hypothetical protein
MGQFAKIGQETARVSFARENGRLLLDTKNYVVDYGLRFSQ